MKIPLNWLKEFVNLPEKQKDLTDKLTMAGHMLDKIEVKNGETVLDLELRGNRADCYSILGIAREVSALFDSKLKLRSEITLEKGKSNVNLEIKTPLVKRVGMIEIKNVVITKSPEWLAGKLKTYGMDSVNNIVDLTNYVMIETGEPMHAFDLDKVGNDLQIRLAINGEKLTTFMGSEITLTDDDLVWAKGEQILSVAGAVGEKFNSISGETKNVLLEAANYDRANIRRTVYRHKLFTDAGIRHEKELDPEMVEGAIGRFLYLLKKYKWGEFSPIFYDYYPKKVTPAKISLSLSRLNSFGGVEIEKSEVINILKRLFMKVSSDGKDALEIEVPTFRTDVTSEEDIIEEVLRVFGYDKIPENVLSLSIPKNITPPFIHQEDKIRLSCTSAGFDEAITNSFVDEKMGKYNVHPLSLGNKIISLVNPPSPDNQYLRTTLLPNLLSHAKKAIDERGGEVRLFELGKIYFKEKNNYKEERKVGLVYFDKSNGSFIKFKSLVSGIFSNLGLPHIEFKSEPTNLPLSQSYFLLISEKPIGFGGSVGKDIYYLELDLESILGRENKYKVSLWPKYPPQIEDMTFSLPEKTKIGEVTSSIQKISNLIKSVSLKDVFESNYTFNIVYQDPARTLTDKEVEEIRDRITSGLKKEFGATVRN